jgi:hypothetical protein
MGTVHILTIDAYERSEIHSRTRIELYMFRHRGSIIRELLRPKKYKANN